MERELNKLEQQIKDYIIDTSECEIEMFRFEYIDPIQCLSKDEQLNKLNFIINKFYDILNQGYPFVAYNFKNNVFNEVNFFSVTIPYSLCGNKEKINIESLVSNNDIKESVTEFVRAKFLEMALKERDLILNSKTEQHDFLNSNETELGLMKDEKRNWLSLKEYENCYPMEYLEFLNVFEEDGQKRVLLDNEALKTIDLLNEKTEKLKTEKLNSFLNKEYTPANENSLNWQGGRLEFITKTELFFIQLKYCLAIDPEPLLTIDNGFYSLALEPETFFKLTNDFKIDYPFIPENKIIELKTLMIKENINTNDALKIIQNFKDQYWVFDAVTIFEPVIEKFKKSHKNINKKISEKELNIELFNFNKYLKAKRDKIYFDLVKELNIDIKTNSTTNPNHENTLFDTGFNFKNNFDNVPEITILTYFTKELIDKKYLTKEKLEEYLIFAFQECEKPMMKFSFDKIKTQKEIIHIFYNYYKIIAQKPYSKKRVYLELLTNYFIGYDYKTIESNFSK